MATDACIDAPYPSRLSSIQVPKLGTVQRWVRLADLSGEEHLAAALLDAIMRTTGGMGGGEGGQEGGSKTTVKADPIMTDADAGEYLQSNVT